MSQVSDLKTHTGYWLRFVSNHVSQQFAVDVSKAGVTVAEWVVLREMFDVEAVSPSTIANAIGQTRGAVSKLVERLRQKGLVKRSEAAQDRRFQDIRLTAAGKALVPKLAAIADRNDNAFFAPLSSREREQLKSLLGKLVKANHLTAVPME